jgi:hypothetical protein
METGKPCEREHDFALVLTGITELTSEAEDALFEAGCDDATLSLRFGRVYATFSRCALSRRDAILRAICDVRKANIGADVLRVDTCDLVTQSEIAHRIGRTRQLVHQYVNGIRGPGGFPPPACNLTDDSPLWYWCEVAYWLWQNDLIKEDVLRDAQADSVINLVLELQHQKKIAPELLEAATRFIESDCPCVVNESPN